MTTKTNHEEKGEEPQSTATKDGPIIALEELLSRGSEDIVEFLSAIYQNSSWVAEKLVQDHTVPNDKDKNKNTGDANGGGNDGHPETPSFPESTTPQSIQTVSDLHSRMQAIVDESTSEQKIRLLQSHPDLCVGKLEQLTGFSIEERGKAGLLNLPEDFLNEFKIRNKEYRDKFGYPFILAVRNATRHTVLSAVTGRLLQSVEQETATALAEVHKIAWMRLLARLDTSKSEGRVTCRVLDSSNGIPASSMRVQLEQVSPQVELIGTFMTDTDGYVNTPYMLKGGTVGVYTLTLFVADYYAINGKTYFGGTPFLDEVPVRFGIDNPDQHFQLQMTVSPWSVEMMNVRQ